MSILSTGKVEVLIGSRLVLACNGLNHLGGNSNTVGGSLLWSYIIIMIDKVFMYQMNIIIIITSISLA